MLDKLKDFIFLFLILGLTPLLAQDPRPNIVFIFADDFGYADLGVYGHPYAETPALDGLAAEGTLFKNFHVTGKTCGPSRAGFMTGRHVVSFANVPFAHGFKGGQTITEILNKNGYRTGHFGKWHIGPEEVATNGIYGIDEVGVIKGDTLDSEGRDAGLFKAAIDFIERNKDVPFYVNVWGHITHYPVTPKNVFRNKFTNLVVNRNDFDDHMQERFDNCISIGGTLNEGMANYLRDVYSLDVQVDSLLQKIEDLGLKDKTIVVFSSDQGPAPVLNANRTVDPAWPSHPARNMLGYAGEFRGRKHSQYEGGVRAPFIIRWPGYVPAGKINENSLTSGLDWLPTLTKITNIPIDANLFEGEDVSDIWLGADRSRQGSLFWKTHILASKISILDGNWKLHEVNGGVELYDLSKDPGERNNIAAANPDMVSDLTQQIADWKATLPTQYAAKGDEPIPVPVVEYNKESGFKKGMVISNHSQAKLLEFVFDRTQASKKEIRVFGINGRLVYSRSLKGSSFVMDYSSFSNSLYFIQIIADGQLVNRKMIL